MNLYRAAVVLIAGVAWAAPASADVVTTWNATTLACVAAGRPGPTGSIDIALVQGAVHDAVQAIQGRFEAYRYRNPSRRGIGTPEAAAAAAAYGMLTGLYGAGAACLAGVQNPAITYVGNPGLGAGVEAAQSFLQIRRPPFVSPIDPFVGGTAPGEWRLTPNVLAGANSYMAFTEPFTLLTSRQFRAEAPRPLTSEQYRRDYDEVKALGRATGSTRTAEQTDLALFWNNPLSELLGAVRTAADAYLSDIGDKARLLSLVSYAVADSQITVYETKYFYNFWRPFTAIREGDGDGNPHTIGDPTWTPLLQTPAYPDHSSGANCLVGAATAVLQEFFGTDAIELVVTSQVGGLLVNPRVYPTLSDLRADMVEVRIYQGIHFRTADVDGRDQGIRVGHWVIQKFLRPLSGR